MASRFWVGGTATWDATAGSKWATTSGGSGGAAVPTAADDVFLDASSGAGVVTLSVGVCRSLNCTGFTGTLFHNSAVTLTIGDGTAGASSIALKLVSGMTYTLGNAATSAITFVSTSATVQSVDSGGKSLGNITFNGAGGSWQLAANLTIASTATLTLTAGTFDINGKTCSLGTLSGTGSTTRTLTLGAASITITGGGTAWNFATTTSLTFNANTSTITLTGNTTFSGGNLTYNTVIMNSAGSNASIAMGGTNTFANLQFLSGAGTSLLITVTANQTVTGTFTCTGSNSGTSQGRVYVCRNNPPGVGATTITAAAKSLTQVDFTDITAAGVASPFSGTSIGDGGGNTNITASSPRTLYWVGNGGNWNDTNHWSTSSGGSAGSDMPLPQDTVNVNASSITSGSQTITVTNTRILGGNVSFSGVLNTPTLTCTTATILVVGNLTFGTGMVTAGSGTIGLGGRGAQTLTTNGVSVGNMNFASSGGSYTLQDNFTQRSGLSLTLSLGTLTANNFNISTNNFASSTANTRTLNMGNGTWTLTGTGTVWNTATVTNFTLNQGSSTIAITDASSTSKTFAGGGKTYGNLSITGGGTGTMIFQGANTFANFTVGAPKSCQFLAGNTVTITGIFSALGSAGNVISMVSSTGGLTFTLSKASGIVSCDYLSLQDSVATGGATWYAGGHSTNVSGNTGWIFTAASYSLACQDALHGQTADTPSLVRGTMLLVSDGSHAQAADNTSLLVQAILAAQDAHHAQTAEQPTLIRDLALFPADARQTQAVDSLGIFARQYRLIPGTCDHSVTTGIIMLAASLGISVDDALQLQRPDVVTLRPHPWFNQGSSEFSEPNPKSWYVRNGGG